MRQEPITRKKKKEDKGNEEENTKKLKYVPVKRRYDKNKTFKQYFYFNNIVFSKKLRPYLIRNLTTLANI